MMEAGNFINGSIMFDLAAEGVSFTTTNRELLPEVTASIEKIKKAILDGKLIVYGTYKEAQKAGLVKDLKYAVYE
jgi:basic membrane protein A